MRATALLALLAVAACAPPDDLPPQLRAPLTDAPYPELQPLAPLLARADQPGRVTPDTGPRLSTEAEALRRRAQGTTPRPRAAPQLTARAGALQARAAALRARAVEAGDAAQSPTDDAALP